MRAKKSAMSAPAAYTAGIIFMVFGTPSGAYAQQNQVSQPPAPPATSPASPQAEAVIVTARRRGLARGNPTPVEVVSEDQLEAARGLSVGEVVERLQRDGTYNENILVNGRPADTSISVDGLPSQAITRIEVLPAQTAAAYGERVDGEVINVVLKSEFRSVQLNASTTATQNVSGLGYGSSVQGTVLEGEAQTSVSVNAGKNVARLSRPQNADEITSLLSPATYEFDVSLQAQRPIKEGTFLTFGGNLGASESDFSDGFASQTEVSLIAATRDRWGLSTTFNTNKTAYFYTLTASLDGTSEDQRSVLERNRKSTVNGTINGSINGVIVKIKDVSLNAGVTAAWRSNSVRNIQIFDGVESILDTNVEQSDVRATLSAPWSNNRGQDVGALSATLGYEAMLMDGQGGNNITSNFSWIPLPRLSLSLNGVFGRQLATQTPIGKPLVVRERAFDVVTRTEGDVTVLRDDDATLAPMASTQIDFLANYSVQTKWPIDLSLQASRTSNSGSFDRPEDPSPELQLQQPSRYLRGSGGVLTTVDLRTRKLAKQERDTLTLNVGLRIPLGPQPTPEATASPDAPTTRAADAIAAASSELNFSLNTQWLIVPRRGLTDDTGLGEAKNRTTLRASWSKGPKSLSLTLEGVGPSLSRDIDGSLFNIPGTLFGGVEYSTPLEFTRGGRTYLKNMQLQASVQNIMLSEKAKLTGVSTQNRFSISDQRGLIATLGVSTSF